MCLFFPQKGQFSWFFHSPFICVAIWKSNFPFSVFEIWSILYSKFLENLRFFFCIVPKDAQCSETNFLVLLCYFSVFKLRSILYYTFIVHSGTFSELFYVMGLCPPKPPVFVRGFARQTPRRRLRSQVRILLDWIPLANWFSGITGLRSWIRFLGSKTSLSPQSVHYECRIQIDNISTTKHRTKKTQELKNPFQNIAHFF